MKRVDFNDIPEIEDLSGYIEAVLAAPLRSIGLGVSVNTVDDKLLPMTAELEIKDAWNLKIPAFVFCHADFVVPKSLDTEVEENPALADCFHLMTEHWQNLGIEVMEPNDESFFDFADVSGNIKRVYLPDNVW